MKKAALIIFSILLGAGIIACPILYFLVGPALNQDQLDTGLILLIILGTSILYCFIVGEIAQNNSQMDKLWSLLPIAYCWVIAAKGHFAPRLLIMAILVTAWGIRLTINFARKGAYSIKFWSGEEDYRWKVLRETKILGKRWRWALFDFFFISLYQNVLVFLISVPALASMTSDKPLNWLDYLAMALLIGSLTLEIVADEQQNNFQTKKWKMIKEGKKLEELPEPYSKGFNTVGLWNHSRHPNYLGEQMIWVSFYIFSIASGLSVFNWSFLGALLLVFLFIGSSTFGEKISASKYPEYADYKEKVSRFIPWKAYRRKDS